MANTSIHPNSEQIKFWSNLECTKTLVNCSKCSHCCSRDFIYLYPFEVEFYKKIGANVIEKDGVGYFKKETIHCPFLDKSGLGCTIYENRPITCRIFPLEIIAKDGILHWAKYNAPFCTVNNRVKENFLNITLYLIIQKIAPLFNKFRFFIKKHNEIEDSTDIFYARNHNYEYLKKF